MHEAPAAVGRMEGGNRGGISFDAICKDLFRRGLESRHREQILQAVAKNGDLRAQCPERRRLVFQPLLQLAVRTLVQHRLPIGKQIGQLGLEGRPQPVDRGVTQDGNRQRRLMSRSRAFGHRVRNRRSIRHERQRIVGQQFAANAREAGQTHRFDLGVQQRARRDQSFVAQTSFGAGEVVEGIEPEVANEHRRPNFALTQAVSQVGAAHEFLEKSLRNLRFLFIAVVLRAVFPAAAEHHQSGVFALEEGKGRIVAEGGRRRARRNPLRSRPRNRK